MEELSTDNEIAREIYKKITTKQALLIGSRGLGVEDKKSDYDVAILRSNLPNNLDWLVTSNIKNYFNVLPLNNAGLVRLTCTTPKMDIIIFEDQADMEVIKYALEETKKISKTIIKNKYLRVKIFEEFLLSKGFKASTMEFI